MRIFFFLLPALGCQAHLRLEVMEPAEVMVDSEVRTLALVNREPSPLSRRSIEELGAALVDSPRFLVVDQGAAQRTYRQQAQVVGTDLSRDAMVEICRETNATGIVSLERYRDRGDWRHGRHTREVTEQQTRTITHRDGTETTVEEEITREEEYFVATYHADLETDWIVYGCNGRIHDRFPLGMSGQWSAEGPSVADARMLVGEVEELEAELAEDLARRYFRRISPYEARLSRRYFRGPNRHLRAGHRLARNGELDAARVAWRVASESERPRLQAKARHNMAVAQEGLGNIERALTLSRRAADELGHYWVDDYVGVLEERRARLERLEQQMSPPEPEPSVEESSPAVRPR